ncbi:MAG: hypothetical protein ACFBZ8_12595, partial [Opitutales bacterium]
MRPGEFSARPTPARDGYCLTFDTGDGRKTLQLPQAACDSENQPVAAESFALHPDVYHALLQRV